MTDRASILFVDDEARVLTAMRAMFRRDYDVHVANSGAEALEILRREAIDVVVSDQRMPEMTGVEVLREARDITPRTMRILLTGYADLGAIEEAINGSEVFRYLMKPCARDQLRETLELAVGAAQESVAVARRRVAATDAPSGASASQELPALLRESEDGVELCVLSHDDGLVEAVRKAVGDGRAVHGVRDAEAAIELLGHRPVGVLVTDAAVDERAVEALTAELQRQVPELVTIVASDRSDAHMMINLINHGQVFRFLLKPLSLGQSRIWLSSAVERHLELVTSPGVARRYQAAERPDEGGTAGLLGGVLRGIRGLRSRIAEAGRARA
jgi:serine/threonine-protein kinase